jgi:glutathione synthase/RimK-type ligase-like ATP-grasp enzyme
MRRKKRNITILALGDKCDSDAYRKFNRARAPFLHYGFDYLTADYKKFISGKTPPIKTDKIIIFFFFPHYYWNKHIEHRHYKGVYGNMGFYNKFLRFWNLVERKLRRYTRKKKIIFINNPRLCATYRDKLSVFKRNAKYHIPQARHYKKIGIRKIQNKLADGYKFFLKPRCGSMGKGITFLSKDSWQTNFAFKERRIISRKSDYGWRFNDVTGNVAFLKTLLKKDILIQEDVGNLILRRNKIDFRVYTFFNKAVYVYPRKNRVDKITTNISQGGRGDPRLLRSLPKSLSTKAVKAAESTAKALNIILAGIDIIPDRNYKDVYVIDVNLFAGFPKRGTFDLAKELAGKLSQLDDKGKLRFR